MASSTSSSVDIVPASLPTQCATATFTLSGGVLPYTVTIEDASTIENSTNTTTSPGFPQTFTNVNNGSFTWLANVTAGTQIAILVVDSDNHAAEVDPIVVQKGTNSNCLGTDATSGGSSSSNAPSWVTMGVAGLAIAAALQMTVL